MPPRRPRHARQLRELRLSRAARLTQRPDIARETIRRVLTHGSESCQYIGTIANVLAGPASILAVTEDHMNIRNRSVLITGASRGLGRALMEAFGREGARVVGVARGKE